MLATERVDKRQRPREQLQRLRVIVGQIVAQHWIQRIVFDGHADGRHVHAQLMFLATERTQAIQRKRSVGFGGFEHGLAVRRTVSFGRQEERSEEHTSELQSLMRISYAVLWLKKKHTNIAKIQTHIVRHT